MSRSGRPLKQKQVKARCIPAAFAGWRVSSFIEGLPNGFNCRVAIIAKPDSLRRHSGVRPGRPERPLGGSARRISPSWVEIVLRHALAGAPLCIAKREEVRSHPKLRGEASEFATQSGFKNKNKNRRIVMRLGMISLLAGSICLVASAPA